MKTKYTLLELMFSDKWRWVRRISNQYWIKMKNSDYPWVKFSDDELLFYKNFNENLFNPSEFEIEDWRK